MIIVHKCSMPVPISVCQYTFCLPQQSACLLCSLICFSLLHFLLVLVFCLECQACELSIILCKAFSNLWLNDFSDSADVASGSH